eukprot:g50.t1
MTTIVDRSFLSEWDRVGHYAKAHRFKVRSKLAHAACKFIAESADVAAQREFCMLLFGRCSAILRVVALQKSGNNLRLRRPRREARDGRRRQHEIFSTKYALQIILECLRSDDLSQQCAEKFVESRIQVQELFGNEPVLEKMAVDVLQRVMSLLSFGDLFKDNMEIQAYFTSVARLQSKESLGVAIWIGCNEGAALDDQTGKFVLERLVSLLHGKPIVAAETLVIITKLMPDWMGIVSESTNAKAAWFLSFLQRVIDRTFVLAKNHPFASPSSVDRGEGMEQRLLGAIGAMFTSFMKHHWDQIMEKLVPVLVSLSIENVRPPDDSPVWRESSLAAPLTSAQTLAMHAIRYAMENAPQNGTDAIDRKSEVTHACVHSLSHRSHYRVQIEALATLRCMYQRREQFPKLFAALAMGMAPETFRKFVSLHTFLERQVAKKSKKSKWGKALGMVTSKTVAQDGTKILNLDLVVRNFLTHECCESEQGKKARRDSIQARKMEVAKALREASLQRSKSSETGIPDSNGRLPLPSEMPSLDMALPTLQRFEPFHVPADLGSLEQKAGNDAALLLKALHSKGNEATLQLGKIRAAEQVALAIEHEKRMNQHNGTLEAQIATQYGSVLALGSSMSSSLNKTERLLSHIKKGGKRLSLVRHKPFADAASLQLQSRSLGKTIALLRTEKDSKEILQNYCLGFDTSAPALKMKQDLVKRF